jgi:hypothetical protein
MSLIRLPETLQTLSAELLDQLLQAETSEGVPTAGAIVEKVIAGRPYLYFQRSFGPFREQRYLGPADEGLRARAERWQEQRELAAPDRERRARLVAMLAAGGAVTPDGTSGRVLDYLADAGVFRHGGVVVGTHAFQVVGNVLGVKWETANLRTEDIDIAWDRDLRVVVPVEPTDALAALRRADAGFLPVPELDHRLPSTSFRVRGRDLRVDFLTPARPSTATAPVPIPRLGVAATPLPFLDYLVAEAIPAVVLSGSGVLVRVPEPARFAVHKLWTAGERSVAFQAKANKDIRQAAQLFEILVEDRPGALLLAGDTLARHQRRVRQVQRGLERITEPLRSRVRELLGLPA